MVDIHFIVVSSHPSHREQETEREVTSRSWAGRSRRAGGHSGATTATTATQHQRTVGTVRTLSPAVGVEATLVVARRLLNNPPSAYASPSAVEQWRHDVDQLIVAAINTPQYDGGRQELTVAHLRSTTAACVPHQMCVLQASQRSTSVMSSSAIAWERIVTSPSNATMRSAATARAVTSSEILNLLRQHERCLRRLL
jgi:hypothetical protein